MPDFSKEVSDLKEYLEKKFPIRIHIDASKYKRSIFYTVEVLENTWLEFPGFVYIVRFKMPDSLYCCTHLHDWWEWCQDQRKEERHVANS